MSHCANTASQLVTYAADATRLEAELHAYQVRADVTHL
jgi:hypothetical protein